MKKSEKDKAAAPADGTCGAKAAPAAAQEASKEPSTEERAAALEAEVKALRKEAADSRNDLLVARADLENTRKRLVREKNDAIKFANSCLIEELLTPMDSLERALASLKAPNGGAQGTEAILSGVRMVFQQFSDALRRNGLERIASAPGTPFDPEEHEACMVEASPSAAAEVVGEELMAGYKLHGRILRPAKVKVFKPEV